MFIDDKDSKNID